MNDKTLISKPPYNLKRIWRKACMVVACFPLLSPSFRPIVIKWGGTYQRKVFYRI